MENPEEIMHIGWKSVKSVRSKIVRSVHISDISEPVCIYCYHPKHYFPNDKHCGPR